LGQQKINYRGEEIDLAKNMSELNFLLYWKNYAGIKYQDLMSRLCVKNPLKLGIDFAEGADKPNIADE
jgi:hypothetical protein